MSATAFGGRAPHIPGGDGDGPDGGHGPGSGGDGDSGDGDGSWDALVDRAVRLVGLHGRVAVHGGWGSGKSTLVGAVAGRWTGRVVRLRGRPGDEILPCSGLMQLDEGLVADGAVVAAPSDRLRLRARVARMLREMSPVLLAVDDVQWLDPVSADVLGYALGSVERGVLGVVTAERTVRWPERSAELMGGHPPVVRVSPAGQEEVSDRLEALGLSARWSGAVLHHCGGNRALLAACCEELVRRPATARPFGRVPLDGLGRVEGLAETWLGTVPPGMRKTLRVASLAHRPDTDLLLRAGCPEAHEHLAHAVRAGVLVAPGGSDDARSGAVRFAARALADAAARTGSAAERRGDHAALAMAVTDPIRAARHRAMAVVGADRHTAQDTARAAATAREDGDRGLSAELMLLAARLTPPRLADLRSQRLADAAQEAAAAGDVGAAHRAARRIVDDHGRPAHQVRALLAVVDGCGQDLAAAESFLAAARGAARDDPRLLAAIELRASVTANVASADFARSFLHATRSAALARTAGDDGLHAAALTMAARMARLLGRPGEARTTLESALALGVPPAALGVSNSPEYLVARHAVFDGDLSRARAVLLELLPLARAAGGAEGLTDLCRSLAEVEAGLGACAGALVWADRARSHTGDADLSPGPAWYTSALVQSCGGSFGRALDYARRALEVSRAEGDVLHTTRSLWITGAVYLHSGRIDPAVAVFEEIGDIEGPSRGGDPAVLRWQPDAVEAFAASGLLDRAYALLAALDEAVTCDASHAMVRATVTRARAVCLAREGDPGRAAGLLDEAAAAFAAMGRPVEQGRTLLTLGRIERRRRRVGAAKAAWEAAAALFAAAEARPWTALVGGHLDRLSGPAADPAPGASGAVRQPLSRGDGTPAAVLTERERHLVDLVTSGSTNPEAADRLFVSRKTVEAMLSRIYRKVGVRNRTELAARAGSRDT
ncbi:LuxR C-terminal-related transcriptional regulator [Streptomyces sp. NPDC059985]|uniref:LuxR C-terminal-related transcriptional regulator n=1 Tax=Streptomyces sp. NPDC059985 TaxID=3347025 RepID=UPI0036D03DED